MPAKSKQQQKFMGLVHAYKKGEVPASKVSKSVKDAAKSMSKKSVKKYAKTKHDELPKKVTEKKERDYKAEYKKFQSSTKAKKYRAELNKYNRQKGTYGNGDGKDASHKGGKIVGFEAQSKNRGRREKSRLKKESTFSVKIDTFQNALKNLDKLSDILKKGGEKKKSMMVSKLVKQLQQAFFRKEIVENITEDITKLEKLAMNLLRNINKNAGVQNYDHKKTVDFNKVVKFLKGKMPRVPNQRIGQIAMSYHDYRKKQPKIRIPDIDSVKDMEKTLKKLGMKEKPIRLKSKSGMGKISHLGMESINETPYELGGMKVYSKADGLKKVKSMQKTGGAKIYKVTKTKTKLYGKHPVTMYNLHTKNKNHSTNQNPYGLDMMKGVYLIPIEEGTCGYGLDGNLGEEPAGPHLMQKIKKITKDKEKLKENQKEKLQIAKTILSQLGGNRFIAMTGAKRFEYDSKGSVVTLQFKIGRNAKQVNIVRINYIKGKDLYEMNFYKGAKLLKKVSNVYADQLQKIFTKHTGMYTRL